MEPRVLCLDALLSVDDASQVLASPEPVKSIRILFRSEEGGGGVGGERGGGVGS